VEEHENLGPKIGDLLREWERVELEIEEMATSDDSVL
jgi:hypothetical protein